jgi:hypothetical protein
MIPVLYRSKGLLAFSSYAWEQFTMRNGKLEDSGYELFGARAKNASVPHAVIRHEKNNSAPQPHNRYIRIEA